MAAPRTMNNNAESARLKPPDLFSGSAAETVAVGTGALASVVFADDVSILCNAVSIGDNEIVDAAADGAGSDTASSTAGSTGASGGLGSIVSASRKSRSTAGRADATV